MFCLALLVLGATLVWVRAAAITNYFPLATREAGLTFALSRGAGGEWLLSEPVDSQPSSPALRLPSSLLLSTIYALVMNEAASPCTSNLVYAKVRRLLLHVVGFPSYMERALWQRVRLEFTLRARGLECIPPVPPFFTHLTLRRYCCGTTPRPRLCL